MSGGTWPTEYDRMVERENDWEKAEKFWLTLDRFGEMTVDCERCLEVGEYRYAVASDPDYGEICAECQSWLAWLER